MTDQPSADEDLAAYHVAVTVFTVVHAADFNDAAYLAELGIRQALRAARMPDAEMWTVKAAFPDQRTVPVQVDLVCEIGMAVRGGRLDVKVNPAAYPTAE